MKVYLVIGLVVAALSGALWYSIERNLETSSKLASTSGALDQQTQEAEKAKAQLVEMKAERDRLVDRLDQIRATESRLESALESERAKRARLEKENETYRNWSRTDLPDAVIRMLRAGPIRADDRLPGVREREGSGSGRAAPEPANSSEERRPAGPD
jgi:LysB family phage lysis regulatory protein